MKENSAIYKIIGNNVKFYRKKAGLIQQELSNKCGVDRSKISDIENGKEDFMFSTLLDIADGLSVDIKKFFMPVKEDKSTT